jgi:hypothetical protein
LIARRIKSVVSIIESALQAGKVYCFGKSGRSALFCLKDLIHRPTKNCAKMFFGFYIVFFSISSTLPLPLSREITKL